MFQQTVNLNKVTIVFFDFICHVLYLLHMYVSAHSFNILTTSDGTSQISINKISRGKTQVGITAFLLNVLFCYLYLSTLFRSVMKKIMQVSGVLSCYSV